MQLFSGEPKLRNSLSRSRVYRKDHVQSLANFDKSLENVFQDFAVINIGWSMHRDQDVALGKAVPWHFRRHGQKSNQGIDHHISNSMNLLWRNAFTLEVDVSVIRRCKQEIGKPV